MIIQMKNVSWVRNRKEILKNINWEVKPGENWAIMGLNGSGKTTLLNMIAGYLWPTSGEITVLGEKFGRCDLRELRKSIGWVSSSLQERLYSKETALDIILSGKYATIGLYDQPGEEDLEQAQRLLEELGCGRLAGQPYHTLSQGEKQRILIARGLINSPRLLILDEPCSGLDFFAREQLLSAIWQLSLRENPPTLLYVSHHLEEILPVFTHTLLIRRGEVYGAGKTSAVLTGANLSGFFEVPVTVQWQDGRGWLRLIDNCSIIAKR